MRNKNRMQGDRNRIRQTGRGSSRDIIRGDKDKNRGDRDLIR